MPLIDHHFFLVFRPVLSASQPILVPDDLSIVLPENFYPRGLTPWPGRARLRAFDPPPFPTNAPLGPFRVHLHQRVGLLGPGGFL